ncbi:MAG TPA: hypothetical protein VF116_13955 [Ktedonobacterales bacterium]
MSHVVELSDEQYETLRKAAEARGQSPNDVLAALLEELRNPYAQPRYYETDAFLKRLGATDEEIAQLNREVAEEEGEASQPHADA